MRFLYNNVWNIFLLKSCLSVVMFKIGYSSKTTKCYKNTLNWNVKPYSLKSCCQTFVQLSFIAIPFAFLSDWLEAYSSQRFSLPMAMANKQSITIIIWLHCWTKSLASVQNTLGKVHHIVLWCLHVLCSFDITRTIPRWCHDQRGNGGLKVHELQDERFEQPSSRISSRLDSYSTNRWYWNVSLQRNQTRVFVKLHLIMSHLWSTHYLIIINTYELTHFKIHFQTDMDVGISFLTCFEDK